MGLSCSPRSASPSPLRPIETRRRAAVAAGPPSGSRQGIIRSAEDGSGVDEEEIAGNEDGSEGREEEIAGNEDGSEGREEEIAKNEDGLEGREEEIAKNEDGLEGREGKIGKRGRGSLDGGGKSGNAAAARWTAEENRETRPRLVEGRKKIEKSVRGLFRGGKKSEILETSTFFLDARLAPGGLRAPGSAVERRPAALDGEAEWLESSALYRQ